MRAAGLARAEGPGRGPVCPLWVLFSPPGQQQDKDPAPASGSWWPRALRTLPQQTEELGARGSRGWMKRSDSRKDWLKWEVNFRQMPLGLATAGASAAHTASLGLVGKDTPHARLFPWKQMQEALWLLPSPSYPPLRQPVGSSSSPASAPLLCPLVKS
uniref:Uncharacterized protein n=1 Tax=Myotis myotis TaxID=51298 RepID=A0A7J7ZWP9_MYOMY|nr:hypothetical protein mMyoMyo1_009648 [Myotis myotis]